MSSSAQLPAVTTAKDAHDVCSRCGRVISITDTLYAVPGRTRAYLYCSAPCMVANTQPQQKGV